MTIRCKEPWLLEDYGHFRRSTSLADTLQRYEQYTISGTKARNAISAWARPCPWLCPGPLTMLLLSGRAQSTSVKANWLCQTQHGCT